MTPDTDKARGISYADGGMESPNVHYPDPDRIAAINAEWAQQPQGPYQEAEA